MFLRASSVSRRYPTQDCELLMIKIYSLYNSTRKSSSTELGLYHGGLLFIGESGEWTHGDYVQLTAESARELAAVLNKWADDDDALAASLDV